jgi:DNA end-binding protein Ku
MAPSPSGGKKPSRKALENATAVIEELSTDWDPESYADCYRERLRRVIDSKRKGRKIEAPPTEKQPKPVPDLMAALEKTLERVRGGGSAADARAAANGDGDELAGLSRDELYERAQKENIPGRSKMDRDELVEALKSG